ncbi:MAG: class I SAM-dependent methyltransferase [Rudanella sp.]|nr:class I SAM-dependent methyltransferase [Rudanella sp.]
MALSTAKNQFFHLLQTTLNEPLGFREGNHYQAVGPTETPVTCLNVLHPNLYGRVLAYGNLGLGEGYMDNWFELENGSLETLLGTLLKGQLDKKIRGNWPLLARIAAYRLRHWQRGQWRNVQHHYDVGDDLFATFLDSSLTYSCGFAQTLSDDLEQLQQQKFDRICRKLALQPGETLLDIGCGYGGLVLHAATHFGVRATGITNSRHHCQTAQERIRQAGLEQQVTVRLDDFKAVREQFDKIVSVGMLEHVPPAQYGAYFGIIKKNLAPQGRGLVHFVGANAHANTHDPFIQRYIFPDSHQPRLSVVLNQVERNDLIIQDVENMIRHYGHTSRAWLQRFRAGQEQLRVAYSDSFLRMWEYYLACCVAGSDYSDGALYQVLFMNDYRMSFPLNRV